MNDERGTMNDEPVVAPLPVVREPYDVEHIRNDFPILARNVRNKRLIYLDNAATTQKPRQMIDRLVRYYSEENSNVHRGVHFLSELATLEYENARGTVQRFIHARSEKEIVFTRGTTESINLVAQTWGRANLREGDEVLISALEHHSNIVPWQMLCDEKGIDVRVIPVSDAGELLIDEYERMLNPHVKLVAVGHASNALGTINPIRRMAAAARANGSLILIDGAQGVPHLPVDVQDLGCDFYAFSGHKVYGPTGIGVLYGTRIAPRRHAAVAGRRRHDPLRHVREDDLQRASLQVRGGHAEHRRRRSASPRRSTTFPGSASKRSARTSTSCTITPRDACWRSKACDSSAPRTRKQPSSRSCSTACTRTTSARSSIGEGIAIRTGHHCAQPLMMRFNVPGHRPRLVRSLQHTRRSGRAGRGSA